MEADAHQLVPFTTPQHSNSLKRPRRSLQSNPPLSSVSESASSSPRVSGQSHLNGNLFEHINALKHLDDLQILRLLEAARHGDRMRPLNPDRSSVSTLGSRASSYLSVPSSRVPSIISDPRSSIASTDSSFTNYSASSSRLSTASSRLSTISTNTSAKNFACTFCDKALKSKPYWKSHEEEFHEQRLTWRCPDCQQIFHAGKRFREHHTKLHGCENCKQPRESGQPTSRKASPCVKKFEIVMHNKDAWGCGFCATLLTTWEERCEHVAQHFEEKRMKWSFTNVILGLLKQTDVSPAWNVYVSQRHHDQQKWPRFAWDPKKCNRLRYNLETAWDIRVFDVEGLVRETYDLAEIETTDPNEVADPIETTDVAETETVKCKLETTYDFPAEPAVPPQSFPAEDNMMDLDPVEQPMHSVSQPELQQTQWPVSTEMAQSNVNGDVTMEAFNGFSSTMDAMPADYTQPVSQNYHQQGWHGAGFASTPDLVNFQQPAYMTYTAAKEVIQVPTSQFANFVRPASQHGSQQGTSNFAPRPASQHTSHQGYPSFAQFPRQSYPPPYHQQTSSTNMRRYIPKLINISSSKGDQPPPPPPKDEHRFSNRSRRPSTISQHTIMPQRDLGWQDELQWG